MDFWSDLISRRARSSGPVSLGLLEDLGGLPGSLGGQPLPGSVALGFIEVQMNL